MFCNRAEDWRALESVLFIADAKVSWRGRAVKVQVSARSVVTHQPHTADAEALRLYIRNQANTRIYTYLISSGPKDLILCDVSYL